MQLRVIHIQILLAVALIAAAVLAVALSCADGIPPWICWTSRGIVGLLAVISIVFYESVVRALRSIALGADLLKARDFSSRLAHVGQHEADRIIDIFNRMMFTLREERIRIQEQDRLLDRLLQVCPMAVIMLDASDRITLANPVAVQLLTSGHSSAAVIGRPLSEFDTPVGQCLSSLVQSEVRELRLNDSMIYRCSRLGFMDRGYVHPFFLVESMTDEVRRAERAAYGKVLRILSHEVNNTVASLSSSLATISEILSDNPEYRAELIPVLRACSDRASETASFVSRLARAVRIPAPEPRPVDLTSLITDCAPLLESACTSRGVRFVLDLPDRPVRMMLDAVLMEQVLVNIVKNGAESASQNPPDRPPCVNLTLTAGINPLLTITDNGHGISDDVAARLFSPFFTTRPDGNGIGLMLVNEVLSAHRLRFSLATSPADRLTRFTIHL